MKIVSIFLFFFTMDGVFGVDPDGVKTVIEGDSVTLQTDFTEMQKDGLIEWKVNNTNIATIIKGTGKVEYSNDKLMMVMFSDRLDLDQTGFLTIWNIRIKHSGEYKVESISSAGTKSRTFNVIVKESPLKSVEDKDEIKALLATKGNSETLRTETELQKHDLILWRFGAEGSLIAKGDIEDNHTSYYYGDDGRFRDRLQIDSKTGSLIITDIGPEHTGEFRLKIISDRRILFRRFTVIVSGSGLSPGAVAAICVVLLLVAAAVAVGVVIFCQRSDFELKKRISKISKQLEQLPKISEQLEKLLKACEQFTNIPEKELSEVCENKINEMSEKLNQMSESCEKELPKISEQLKQLHEQKIPEQLRKLSEKLLKKPKQFRTNAIDNETSRSETEEDESVGYIYGIDTLSRKTHGTDERFKDRQGRKSHVHPKDCTHESTEETGFMEEDGVNE